MTSEIRPALRDQIRELLLEAAQVYRDSAAAGRFERAASRLDEPLLVAIAGRVKAGKSTLLNALVGRVVAATDAGECTRLVTSYSWGPRLSATVHLVSGSTPVTIPIHEDGDRLVPDLGGLDLDLIERLKIQLPSPSLQRVTLLDTPGIGSLTPELGARSERLLGQDPDAAVPDAVIYLIRQLHVSDVDFLEAFRDPVSRTVPPVNAVAVLSHADEVGGGRPDALQIASRLADSYAAEPMMRPLVQTVVAVAGLLAEASATLTPAEYDDLLRLAAGVEPSVLAPMLLSASRFVAHRRYLPVGPAGRRSLIARLGLFGVRWALDLVRHGPTGSLGAPAAQSLSLDELRDALNEMSGAAVLKAVLESQITGRRDVLKADAALRLVQQTVAALPVPDAHRLSAAAERIRVSTHDFEELRLLNELRLGAVELAPDERVRGERLLGARGGSLPERLDLPPDAGQVQLLGAVLAEHHHWHELGSDVLAPPALVRACAVLERTCAHLHSQARAGVPS